MIPSAPGLVFLCLRRLLYAFLRVFGPQKVHLYVFLLVFVPQKINLYVFLRVFGPPGLPEYAVCSCFCG